MTPSDTTDRFAARIRAAGLTTPLRRDAALAAVVAVASVVLVLVALPLGGAAALVTGPLLVLIVLQAAALALRTTRPLLCLAVVVALQVALTALVSMDVTIRTPTPFVAAYGIGVALPALRALAVVGAAAVVEALGFLVIVAPEPWSLFGQLVSALVLYVAAAQVGAYVQTRRRYVEVVALRAAEAVAAQRARADAAVGAERVRMARELHDIAAHHLAGMVVQAGVVERLIDRDPDAARVVAAQVREQGRATLRDLRMVVGALRDSTTDHDDGGAPVPGLSTLTDLAPDVVVLGTPYPLPPVADVSVHRVAQEALANARDHAPGAAVAVTVTYGPAATTLDVQNAPPRTARTDPAPLRGFGLVGMRERAALIGADLDAGPTPDGGWRVRLTVPRAEDDT